MEDEATRSVAVDGVTYYVSVKPSAARHVDRFGTRAYAVVEQQGGWQATVPVPDGVRSSAQLWYRELVQLVQQARLIVGRRTVAA
jgi:hypothetical protein